MTQPMGLEPELVVKDLVEEIRRLNDRSEALEDINRRMHERVAALEGDLLRSCLRPVIKALAELHGECGRHAQHVRDSGAGEDSVAFAEDFLTTAVRVENILEALGAVSLGVDIGDPFDRRIHQSCGVIATDVDDRHDRVGVVHHQGFRNIESDKPVVYAKVSVWKTELP